MGLLSAQLNEWEQTHRCTIMIFQKIKNEKKRRSLEAFRSNPHPPKKRPINN